MKGTGRMPRPIRGLSLVLVGALAGATLSGSASAGPGDPATRKFARKVAKKKAAAVRNELTPLIASNAAQLGTHAAELGTHAAELEARLHDDVTVVTDSTSFTSVDERFALAPCPAGKIAIGGGAAVGGFLDQLGPDEVALKWSFPQVADGVPVGWRAAAAENGATSLDWRILAWAICATP